MMGLFFNPFISFLIFSNAFKQGRWLNLPVIDIWLNGSFLDDNRFSMENDGPAFRQMLTQK